MSDKAAVVAAAIAAGAAYFLMSRNASAETSVADQDTSDVPTAADENPYVVQHDPEWQYMADNEPPRNDYLQAFLFMIRSCEHVYPHHVLNDECYGIFYAGIDGFNAPEFMHQRFSNFADHPVITGACRAVPLPANFCAAAGLSAGCVSTAAGAYQIIKPTWLRVRAGNSERTALPDFSPASQDEAAIRLLIECGAFEFVIMGDIQTAIRKASKVWASLPGSTAQQNPKREQYALDRFNEGLFIG